MPDALDVKPKRQCPWCKEWCAHEWCGKCERMLPAEHDWALSIQIGDRIRFSVEVLRAMTEPDYPLVRVVAIRRADDGSKTIRLAYP